MTLHVRYAIFRKNVPVFLEAVHHQVLQITHLPRKGNIGMYVVVRRDSGNRNRGRWERQRGWRVGIGSALALVTITSVQRGSTALQRYRLLCTTLSILLMIKWVAVFFVLVARFDVLIVCIDSAGPGFFCSTTSG